MKMDSKFRQIATQVQQKEVIVSAFNKGYDNSRTIVFRTRNEDGRHEQNYLGITFTEKEFEQFRSMIINGALDLQSRPGE